MAAPKKIAEPQADLAALLQRAAAHHKRGELDEAERLYRQILDAQPGQFDALHLCGVLMQQRGEPAQALQLIGAALAANAGAAPAHSALYNRGNALVALGRLEEALASFDEALALRPDYAAALLNRAQVLQRLGRPREALAGFDRALTLAPGNADALIARGNTHYALTAFAAALTDYDSALRLRPDAAPIHNNRGNALRELGRPAEALASFDRAIALKPHYAEAHNNRGNALIVLNRITEALAAYERALALKPDFADALVNRGSALHYLGRAQEAIANFDFAIALEPQLAEAHWNKALTCLTSGDFARGWDGYEWRWRRNNSEMAPRQFAQPQWRGEDLRGRTILLHAEQGFGDTIQFIRYLPMVAAKGGRIVLEVPDDLRPLIATDGIVALVRRGEALPPFDLHCPLMSLAGAFGTTLASIPAPVPYLHAPAERVEKWRARLAGTAAPRVGLVWSGKPTHKNDRNRSIPLAQLAPLLARPDVTFVSLQQDAREADRAALAASPLLRLDGALADFADTAAVVAALDLVIAVDTAVAHLAGAMGKPAWILLPAIGDWRWMAGRADSPWYPSARLFRQPEIGDWPSVIARVSGELALFAPAAAR